MSQNLFTYPRTSVLHRSAGRDDINDIFHQVTTKVVDIEIRAAGGNTPLHFAVLHRQAWAAKELIELGADVNARGANGQTPLIMAVRQVQPELCALLLEHGASPTAVDNDGRDARYWALHIIPAEITEDDVPFHEERWQPHPGNMPRDIRLAPDVVTDPANVIRELLDAEGIGENDIPGNGWFSKAFSAQDFVDTRTAEQAFTNGFHVDYRDWYSGDTALHIAVFNGNLELMQYLLERGANPNARGEFGLTPLMQAAFTGNEQAVLLLLEYGASPLLCTNGKAAEDYTPVSCPRIVALLRSRGTGAFIHGSKLLRAACYGCRDFEELVQSSTTEEINLADPDGNTPLHHALKALRFCDYKKIHPDVALQRVLALLRKNADIFLRNKEGVMPLGMIFRADLEYAQKLIVQIGTDKTDADGLHMLHYAIRANSLSAVRLLVELGVPPTLPTPSGHSPLALALAMGHKQIAAYLQQLDTRPVEQLPEIPEPKLMVAAANGKADELRALLKAGANPDGELCGIANPTGIDKTPLSLLVHAPCSAEVRLKAAQLLLLAGASVREFDVSNSVLHWTMGLREIRLIQLLLMAGADVTRYPVDEELCGSSPLEEALYSGTDELTAKCVQVLLDHGMSISMGYDASNLEYPYSPMRSLTFPHMVDVLKYLLEHGLNANEQDDDGNTLLHYAALYNGSEEMKQLLLTHGADAPLRNYAGKTAQELNS